MMSDSTVNKLEEKLDVLTALIQDNIRNTDVRFEAVKASCQQIDRLASDVYNPQVGLVVQITELKNKVTLLLWVASTAVVTALGCVIGLLSK